METAGKKTRIGLVQINNSFSGQNYLPYSVGILQAYAEKYLKDPSRIEFMVPIYRRDPVASSVEKLLQADFVFFSAYVWNINISVEIARQLKEKKPEIVLVFGGPQVPDHSDEFLKKFTFIDAVTHGEGEHTFLELLETDLDQARMRQWGEIPGVSFLVDGVITNNVKRERIKDIGVIPSPYLSGVFAKLMQENPQERWIMLWETNRGCPFSCTYCDWGSSTQSRVFRFDMERVYQEADWMAENKIEYVFCADANFGMLERDLEIAQYVANKKKEFGFPHALSVQNTKNATERAYKVQKLLSDSGLNKGVTIALQSTDPETLKNVKRSNISTESFQELQRRFTRDRVDTYSDYILALPGETYQSLVDGVCAVIENGQHNRIQFGNLSILPNAAMGDPEYQKKFGMVLVESPVSNIHGSINPADDEILENQILVVGTNSCPKPDWIRSRAFAWSCSLFYFNKILQIPLLLLFSQFGVRFKDMLTVFTDGDLSAYPTLSQIQKFFRDKALDIQNGGSEYCASKEYLNIWWPPDELVLIQICNEGKLEAFYAEAEAALGAYLKANFIDVPKDILHEAFQVNQKLMKLPFQSDDLTIDLQYNIWNAYLAARVGEKIPLEKMRSAYKVERSQKSWTDWQEWCREVIWWGNKKGAYLYTNMTADPQVSGHY